MLRPDLVVHLAGGKSVVVDAKVSLEAFLDAASSEDDDEREAHLQRHVRQLRTHVDQLGSKAYWRALDETPEFVVMFIPAEAFLSAALDTQSDLLDYAATKHVILATPTTLIALLRTVAHGWSHETLAAQAAEVRRLGAELHQRLGSLGGHLDKVGRSLGAAVAAYNAGVGSLEGRVLVTARRFSDLGVTADDLPTPRQVEEAPRRLSAPELGADEPRGAAVDPDDFEVDDFEVDDFEALGEVATPGRRRGDLVRGARRPEAGRGRAADPLVPEAGARPVAHAAARRRRATSRRSYVGAREPDRIRVDRRSRARPTGGRAGDRRRAHDRGRRRDPRR